MGLRERFIDEEQRHKKELYKLEKEAEKEAILLRREAEREQILRRQRNIQRQRVKLQRHQAYSSRGTKMTEKEKSVNRRWKKAKGDKTLISGRIKRLFR